jgi:hypothetical protein
MRGGLAPSREGSRIERAPIVAPAPASVARRKARVALEDSPGHSFQAPEFYRRHGFAVVGEIAGYPAGHTYLLTTRPLG